MKENLLKDALESIARRDVPEDINLMPRLAVRLERKTFMMTLRAHPLLALLIALLSLLLLGGIAYALSRSQAYIPGYGLVDQNVQMRILSAPVSQTRDGITITINEILLASDQVFMKTTTENIPNNLFIPMSDTTTAACSGDWVYLLPDGTSLKTETGSSQGIMEPLESGNEDRLSYRGSGSFKLSQPVNLNEITEMTLHIPCVTSDIPVGELPENWEFDLHFVPAPADMIALTAFPVIEISPGLTPSLVLTQTAGHAETTSAPLPTRTTPTPEPVVDSTHTPTANPISVKKVIDAGDSYILLGEFDPAPGSVSGNCCSLVLQDAAGQENFDEMPMDIDPGTPAVDTPGAFTWARRFRKEDVTLPITIKVRDQRWTPVSFPFEFDAGDNPQAGDEWKVSQVFSVGGVPFTLETIQAIRPNVPSSGGGYVFTFTYPLETTQAGLSDIRIDQYPAPVNSGFGGGGSSKGSADALASIHFSVEFPTLPKGKFTVQFVFSILDGEEEWTLPWQP